MNPSPGAQPTSTIPKMVLIWFVSAIWLALLLIFLAAIQIIGHSATCSANCVIFLLIVANYAGITALLLSPILAILLFALRTYLFRYQHPLLVWLFLASGFFLGVVVADVTLVLAKSMVATDAFLQLFNEDLPIALGLSGGMMSLLTYLGKTGLPQNGTKQARKVVNGRISHPQPTQLRPEKIESFTFKTPPPIRKKKLKSPIRLGLVYGVSGGLLFIVPLGYSLLSGVSMANTTTSPERTLLILATPLILLVMLLCCGTIGSLICLDVRHYIDLPHLQTSYLIGMGEGVFLGVLAGGGLGHLYQNAFRFIPLNMTMIFTFVFGLAGLAVGFLVVHRLARI
ncbi:MAG: hypothetical protein KC445_15595 [Anaerolineales bacterium]|nr:hypothetical protein [Anaerolineales bacterium]